jgi:hypothetical protein
VYRLTGPPAGGRHQGRGPIHPTTPRLVAALALVSLAAGCAAVSSTVEKYSSVLRNSADHEAPPAAASAPPAAPDPKLLPVLAGRWRPEAKARDALVPDIVLWLYPDGRLILLRDDSGGTNFAVQLWGTWAASSPAPNLFLLDLDYEGVQPKRRCNPVTGRCRSLLDLARETWSFTATGPDTMETAGAVWHRSPLS